MAEGMVQTCKVSALKIVPEQRGASDLFVAAGGSGARHPLTTRRTVAQLGTLPKASTLALQHLSYSDPASLWQSCIAWLPSPSDRSPEDQTKGSLSPVRFPHLSKASDLLVPRQIRTAFRFVSDTDPPIHAGSCFTYCSSAIAYNCVCASSTLSGQLHRSSSRWQPLYLIARGRPKDWGILSVLMFQLDTKHRGPKLRQGSHITSAKSVAKVGGRKGHGRRNEHIPRRPSVTCKGRSIGWKSRA